MAPTRLGINLAAGSLGWCLYELDPAGEVGRILDMGVRIFSDGREPRSGTPLAVTRRLARAARRRRDRYLRRRTVLLETLGEIGLLPRDPDEARALVRLDPYQLRKRALDERLELSEIGRLLFHLNQRRGVKLGRKADALSGKPGETAVIAAAVAALDSAMVERGDRTYGEFLADQASRRIRQLDDGGYAVFPERRHLEDEYNAIWASQAPRHPDVLTTAVRDQLRRIIFFQRPLKTGAGGTCRVFPTESRLPRAHPLFQMSRLYETAGDLRIADENGTLRRLTLGERDKVLDALRKARTVTLARLKKLLNLGTDESVHHALGQRAGVPGDEISVAFGRPRCFGARWAGLAPQVQWLIIEEISQEDDADRLNAWLCETFGTSPQAAQDIAGILLPIGFGRLGETATRRLLDTLEKGGIDGHSLGSDEAFDQAFGDLQPTEVGSGAGRETLPYYGEILTRHIPPGTLDPRDEDEKRWGRMPDPTMHIGLNQLRRVVNAIIGVHGRPDTISVELGGGLLQSERDKARHARDFRENALASRRRTALLQESGQPDTGANRALLRFWELLNPSDPSDRCCPFCGNAIAREELFKGQAVLAHVVPYSRSLDDSQANTVIAHQRCRHEKGSLTPWECWGGGKDPARWDVVALQAARMNLPRRWRFGPQAMARYASDGGIVARQLTHPHHLARSVRLYLACLYPTSDRVITVSGRLTVLLRRIWGLNRSLPDHAHVPNPDSNAPRNRLDLRHHAIDAAVAGAMSPRVVEHLVQAARRAEDQDLPRLFDVVPIPFDGFREHLADAVLRIVTSHKAEHGRMGRTSRHHDETAAKLHNDTAYGLTGLVSSNGQPIVVHRVPLASLTASDIADPGRIPDPALRAALVGQTQGRSGKDFALALKEFAASDPLFKGIRHVRVRTTLRVIEVRDRHGRAYKGFKGDTNAWVDIWRLPDGQWKAVTVSMFAAHRQNYEPERPHPAAKKVMSLRPHDMLAIEKCEGNPEVYRVVKTRVNGQVTIAAHHEGGNLKERDARPVDVDPFKYVSPTANGLRKLAARQVRVDEMGRVFDPGWRF